MIPASSYGEKMEEGAGALQLDDEEKTIQERARGIWRGILNLEEIADDTDFFACGAGSMDVVR